MKISSRYRPIRAALMAAAAGVIMTVGSLAGATPARADTYVLYYRDYFYCWNTCDARGHQLMQTQPDWLWFDCFQAPGQTKWSMGVMLDDDFGCRVAFNPTVARGAEPYGC